MRQIYDNQPVGPALLAAYPDALPAWSIRVQNGGVIDTHVGGAILGNGCEAER